MLQLNSDLNGYMGCFGLDLDQNVAYDSCQVWISETDNKTNSAHRPFLEPLDCHDSFAPADCGEGWTTHDH